jgi:hypothetical protein
VELLLNLLAACGEVLFLI